MSTQPTLNATVIDVLGQYNQAAKSLVATYRDGTQRVVGGIDQRCSKLVADNKLPLVPARVTERLVDAEQRLAAFVVKGVDRAADRADATIDKLSQGAIGGVNRFAEETAWAKDLFVVNALRSLNMPAAKLSLQIAEQVAHGARRVSERVAGTSQAREMTAATPVKTATGRGRRVRKAS
jgi:hypothetical protein